MTFQATPKQKGFSGQLAGNRCLETSLFIVAVPVDCGTSVSSTTGGTLTSSSRLQRRADRISQFQVPRRHELHRLVRPEWRGRLLAHLAALWLGVARRRAILCAKHTVGWQERSGLPCHASAKGMGPATLLCFDRCEVASGDQRGWNHKSRMGEDNLYPMRSVDCRVHETWPHRRAWTPSQPQRPYERGPGTRALKISRSREREGFASLPSRRYVTSKDIVGDAHPGRTC